MKWTTRNTPSRSKWNAVERAEITCHGRMLVTPSGKDTGNRRPVWRDRIAAPIRVVEVDERGNIIL